MEVHGGGEGKESKQAREGRDLREGQQGSLVVTREDSRAWPNPNTSTYPLVSFSKAFSLCLSFLTSEGCMED